MKFYCACCGIELPGDGLFDCLIVNELTTEGEALVLRFGRECGCASKLLTYARLAARDEAGLALGRTVEAKRRR